MYENKLSLPLILLNVGRIEMNADWNFPSLCSPFLRIYYVEQGEARVDMHGKSHRLRPGHLYMIPPFTRHSDSCSGPFVHYYMHILDQTIQGQNIYEQNLFPFELEADNEAIALVHRLMDINPYSHLRQSAPASYDNRQAISEAVNRFTQKRNQQQYETQAILMMLISRFYNRAIPQKTSNDDRLIRVQRYIRQHLDTPLPLDELAGQAAICKDSLIRLFKRELGITPVDYIINKRIERAQMLLLTHTIPVKEIALQLGFSNQSYFTSQFKRITGLTPLEYRKQHRFTDGTHTIR